MQNSDIKDHVPHECESFSLPSLAPVLPISGRYAGRITSPIHGCFEMDLRIDVDPLHENSIVCHCISWDLTQLFEDVIANRSCRWRVDRGSWILQSPDVKTNELGVEIQGAAIKWNTAHSETQVWIRIPRNEPRLSLAQVTLDDGATVSTYQCEWQSHYFRDVALQIDVCAPVNLEPVLPRYDTPQRTLTIESVYADAGINVTINTQQKLIEDEARAWTPGELHQTMEDHFSELSGSPQWKLWGLIAGRFQKPNVAGIMFNRAELGSNLPERRGFAVFREHDSFDGLKPDEPGMQQTEASRKYLHTFIHEIGHAFNLQHSWEKDRPNALSWMNTAANYDERNGQGSFWCEFDFRFDYEELVHLRHGSHSSVVFGGDVLGRGNENDPLQKTKR